MKVLVTGASGFIGRNVLLALPSTATVVATWNRDATFPAFVADHGLDHVEPLRVDMADAAALASVASSLGDFDACVYLAANGDPAYSSHAPADDLRANAVALVNLLSACRFERFVLFSSGAVYDGLQGEVGPSSPVCPTLPYAISKFASERYVMHAVKQGRISVGSNVRFFGAYGPYEASRKIYGRLVRQFALDRSPRFTIRGDGRNLIDAMYVDDTVRAILAIVEKAETSGTFDLASQRPITLTDLVTTAGRHFGIEAEIEYVGEVPEYIEFRSSDPTMRERFGFTPTVDLAEGLQRFYAWMSKEPTCPQPMTN